MRPPEPIVASNTAPSSSTRLASSTDRPERFIGIHFMNPVPLMELVEVIRGIATDDATFEASKTFVSKLGKTIAVSEDFPAFIVNDGRHGERRVGAALRRLEAAGQHDSASGIGPGESRAFAQLNARIETESRLLSNGGLLDSAARVHRKKTFVEQIQIRKRSLGEQA